jgi:uncharacterized membrane protein
MLEIIKKICIIFVLLIIIDALYFIVIGNFFDKQIKNIQGTSIKINFIAFILCYIFIAIGLYYFIIKEKRSIYEAFLLGLVIYAIYELTNKTLITNWNWSTVFIDSIWGGILFMIVSFIMKNIFN